MTILVIGYSGQVARALRCLDLDNLIVLGRPDVDLERHDTLSSALDFHNPGIVLNTAAYTQVDAAENDRDISLAVNRDGPKMLAEMCAERDIPIVHMSTDCVFDGKKAAPYEPEDVPNPANYYGYTKELGERAVKKMHPRSIVVRVSWVYSEFGSNFVHAMLRLATSHSKVTVVSDQFGFPTHATWLAKGLVKMCNAAIAPGFDSWGTYHLAGSGETNRAEQAEEIFRISEANGGPIVPVEPILTKDYDTPARRPLNARLGSQKTIDTFGVDLIDWKDGHALAVPKILKELGVT